MSSEDEKRRRNRERSTSELERLRDERKEKGKPTRLIKEELDRRRQEEEYREESHAGGLSEHHWR